MLLEPWLTFEKVVFFCPLHANLTLHNRILKVISMIGCCHFRSSVTYFCLLYEWQLHPVMSIIIPDVQFHAAGQPLHLSTSTMVKSNSQFHFFSPMFHWLSLVGRSRSQTFVRGSGFIRSGTTSLHCLELFLAKKQTIISRYWEHLDLRIVH